MDKSVWTHFAEMVGKAAVGGLFGAAISYAAGHSAALGFSGVAIVAALRELDHLVTDWLNSRVPDEPTA